MCLQRRGQNDAIFLNRDPFIVVSDGLIKTNQKA